MTNILYISDMDFSGSGYLNISVPLLCGLADKGHDIKCLGLQYKGTEHNFPFSIIPASDFQDIVAMIHNLKILWQPEIIIVALDLPLQASLREKTKSYGIPYIAITPLEEGPLTMSWAAPLIGMDGVFFISELGKQAALKAGVLNAEHIQIGVDTNLWHPPSPEEKAQLRKGMGIAEDEFVIFTNADNQERKNLWAGLSIVSKLKEKSKKKLRYVLVTREHNPYGFKLRDFALEMNINQELMIFERGMPAHDLWVLYAISDAFLLPTKAEGLGMILLEAMGCGVPVVATHTGAIPELLEGRGFPIQPEYVFRDVWGNSTRNMIDRQVAADNLVSMVNGDYDEFLKVYVDRGIEYVKSRTWEIAVNQVDDKIMEIMNEQAAAQPQQ